MGPQILQANNGYAVSGTQPSLWGEIVVTSHESQGALLHTSVKYSSVFVDYKDVPVEFKDVLDCDSVRCHYY